MKAILLRALGLLLLALSILAAAFYAPERSLQSLIANWAPPPSDFIELQLPSGAQLIHLRDQGPRDDPLPLILLHGTSASLHTWQGWVSGLATTRRVISYDLPGSGLTGPTPDGDYRDERHRQALLALMDRLAVKRAVLVGNSLGGQIAWQLAALRPERVAGLVLVDPGGLAFAGESIPMAFRLAALPGFRQLSSKLLPRRLVEDSVRDVYGEPSRVTPALVDRYFELTLREGNREAVALRMAQRESGRYADLLEHIKQPTLILWGGRDRLSPPVLAREFERRIAGSRLVMFDALGHVPHEEDPVATLKPVRDFLDGMTAVTPR
ncbi:alpha/beta fold hydrolase [Pelomonas sp. SE-A7]|uniref:alpha/beta fold hydrolase n=1 Tax=Pelomonas sp. SE-A7 TaxID=3054953 RepID=UPI00259C9B17|nr:alpha/beta fold hydrolase [Pelomonas sp. SE-A7]MDM4765561.1 alpha/beta fold hydrolase [Pelomonas sp. SE-A7]